MGSASPSLETIIAEAYLKCANIVLASRLPALQPARVDAAEASKRRAWFNIEVPEDAGAASTLQRWRKDVGLPLVLEVFLQPWGARDPLPGGEQAARVETLLERWVLHYHPMLPESPTTLSRSQLLRLNPSSVYKRLVIMLRSLYSYVRLLPAYRMYRACKRQRSASFGIGYRLHSTLPGRAAGAAPGMRRLQHFAFAPVDTPYGQFRASVDYQPASTVTILEQTTSPPPLPQIIADYVGSPRAAAGAASARGLPLRHAMSASAFGGERGGSGAGTRASPPVVGREVSASTALMRRPSWAARSGASFQGEAPGAPGGVGYSVSPMGDATFEALLAGSTPRVFAAAGALGPGALGQLASPGLGGPPITVSRLGSGARHLLTYPAASGDIVIDETDVLPFALDGDAGASPNKPASPAPPGVRPPVAPTDRPAADDAPAGAGATAGSEREPAAAGAAAEPSSDAAVGAFVRLLQEAPPLRFVRAPAAQAAPGLHGASAGSELTLQAGLQHLHRVRQRLQEQGVLPTAVHV